MATKQTRTGPQNPTDLAEKIAARKALDDEIRAMKASQPKMTPLERVIARQEVNYGAWMARTLASRTLARIAAGQDAAEAIIEVTAFFTAKTTAIIEEVLSRDKDADAKLTENGEK
jgi:hypothetical protein